MGGWGWKKRGIDRYTPFSIIAASELIAFDARQNFLPFAPSPEIFLQLFCASTIRHLNNTLAFALARSVVEQVNFNFLTSVVYKPELSSPKSINISNVAATNSHIPRALRFW